MVIRDVALHMSNRPTNYRNEDTGLCRGALKSRSQHPCTTEAGSSSVQEYLETSQFVQVRWSLFRLGRYKKKWLIIRQSGRKNHHRHCPSRTLLDFLFCVPCRICCIVGFFAQIATLNFLDAFLRTRTQVIAPRDAFAAVELWMGILHVYTCQDSLSTCHVSNAITARATSSMCLVSQRSNV